MNMAISVYEYEKGRKSVYMLRFAHTGIREMKMQMKKEFRHMGRVMHISIGTVTQVSIKFVQKEERKIKRWSGI